MLQCCTDGLACRRRVCFFAHQDSELRKPEEDPALLAAQLQAESIASEHPCCPKLPAQNVGFFPIVAYHVVHAKDRTGSNATCHGGVSAQYSQHVACPRTSYVNACMTLFRLLFWRTVSVLLDAAYIVAHVTTRSEMGWHVTAGTDSYQQILAEAAIEAGEVPQGTQGTPQLNVAVSPHSCPTICLEATCTLALSSSGCVWA